MDLLIAHMEDLAAKAGRAGWAASRFLTPAEMRIVAEYFKYKRVGLSFDGGFSLFSWPVLACSYEAGA